MIYSVNLQYLHRKFELLDDHYNEFYVVKFKDAQGKIKQFGVFAVKYKIKEGFQKRGHGTRIMNTLLRTYDFILIKNELTSWWTKFPHIDCNSQEGNYIRYIINNPDLSNYECQHEVDNALIRLEYIYKH